ncbi:hypothetical protein PGB90_007960 [Kerria lacca]
MDKLFEISIKNFFFKRNDLFGENSKFLKFNISKNNTLSLGDNSSIIFGQLEYEENGKKKSTNALCVKLMPVIVNYKSCNVSCFMNEICFYVKMLSFFESVNVKSDLFAKFYDGGVEINEKGEHAIMITEDLIKAGFVNSGQQVFLDYVHLALMMRKLGEFHALSYKARKANPNMFFSLAMCFTSTIYSVISDFFSVTKKNINIVLQELRNDPKYSTKLKVIEKMSENASAYIMESVKRFWNKPNSVISHLYYSPANVLFQYKNDVPIDLKILDLTYCQLTSPGVDISFVLYFNADQRMRNEHWNDLIDEYYNGLSKSCSVNEIPTKEWINDEVNGFSHLYGIIFAVSYLPFVISKERDFVTNKKKWSEILSKCGVDPSDTNISASDKISSVIGLKQITDVFKDAIDRGFFQNYEQIQLCFH